MNWNERRSLVGVDSPWAIGVGSFSGTTGIANRDVWLFDTVARVIRFTEASTRLVAPIGQWVTIGGASQQSNEVIRAVLEAGRGERSSVTSISLLVESGN